MDGYVDVRKGWCGYFWYRRREESDSCLDASLMFEWKDMVSEGACWGIGLELTEMDRCLF